MRPDNDRSDGATPHARRVATIGLHSSASTWVFNVVRELLIASFGDTHVRALYADEMSQVPIGDLSNSRHTLLKSHQGSLDLDEWLAGNRFEMVLSIRDPRDAAVSMAQRFKAPLAFASGWILADCERIMRLATADCPVLRYEDRFFDQLAAVQHLAHALEIPAAMPDLQAIFDRYRTEEMRALARAVKNKPSEFTTKIDRFTMDKVTLVIGDTHIGDTRSGKWRDLPAAMQAKLTEMYAPFIERFAY